MKNSKKGFTIIEVVLVLAIAGLIFLMVFVALPALQRSQRDTQRRQDYANLSANITTYMVNNGGKLPENGINTLAASKYINATGKDPNGKDHKTIVYKATIQNTVTNLAAPKESEVYIYTNADCSGDKNGFATPKVNSSSKAFAIYGYLETGTYCQSSI